MNEIFNKGAHVLFSALVMLGTAETFAAPYGGVAQSIPGRVEAEKYNTGGQNVGFSDTTPTNLGKAFRPSEGVDLESNSSGVWLSYVEPAEWVKYDVRVEQTAKYDLIARVSAIAAGRSFKIEVDGVSVGTVNVPNTGGWKTFIDVKLPSIQLTAGARVIRISTTTGLFNLDYLDFIGPVGGAYGGTPQAIPGRLEAEKYNLGGPNVAFSDTTPTNLGKAFRPSEGVDLQSGAAGVWLSYVEPGEWLKYDVRVAKTAKYDLVARVAAIETGRSFKIEVDGKAVATINVPNTGDWATFKDVTVKGISLTAGNRVVRVVATTGLFNLNYLDFKEAVAATPSAAKLSHVYLPQSVGHGYAEYLPEGYNLKANWPLLIFFHGSGERGTGNTAKELDLVISQGGPLKQVARSGTKYPFVIVAPQSQDWGEGRFASGGSMHKFFQHVVAKYKVDPRKISVTGLSMGGSGVWHMLKHHSSQLAAAVPIATAAAGAFTQTVANQVVDDRVAVWVVHAKNDTATAYKNSVTYYQRLLNRLGETAAVETGFPTNNTTYAAMTANFDPIAKGVEWNLGQSFRDASGSPYEPPYLLTLYRTGGHVIWDRMFTDPQFYEWLLLQSR